MHIKRSALGTALSALRRRHPRAAQSVFDETLPWAVRARLMTDAANLGIWPPVEHVDRWEYEPHSGRFVFWAAFADPVSGFLHPAPGQRVVYAIEGTRAVGAYARYSDLPLRLERHDRQNDLAAHLGQDGRWHWSPIPREVSWRGSDIGNDPVTAVTAAWIAAQLGHPGALDDEHTVRPYP